MNSEWQIIVKKVKQNLPFALFKLPDDKPQIIVQNNDALNISSNFNFSQKGFICLPFQTKSIQPSFIIKNDFSAKIDEDLSDIDLVFPKNEAQQSTAQATYVELVKNIQQAIEKQVIKKAIASKIEILSNNKNSPFTWFKKACQFYPDAFVYFWYHPKVGSWLGATPEKFLSYQNGQAQTVALAGTKPFSNNIVWTEKEINEQALVGNHIETVCENLNLPFSKSATQTVKAGGVAHLKTKYQIEVEKNQLPKLIKALHPTPAVSGLPKKEAIEIINQFEEHNRNYYCGFLGVVNENDINLFVNLRCLEIFSNCVVLYLGAGITKDSIPNDEWNETCLKSETMKKVIL